MKIEAAVLHGREEAFKIEEVELAEPRDDEVLVRIVATGICHSDLAVVSGDLPLKTPIVLGHEGSGVVERVGARVTRTKPGDHVVLTFASCGACLPCLTGHPVYCVQSAAMNLTGTRADGSTAYRQGGETVYGHFVGQSSFATHALVHERAAVVVSPDAPLELMAPLGCGIQTGAGTVFNVFRPSYGSSLAVTGTGSVGLSGIMAAKAVGCQTIVAVDISPSRLDLAVELGATHAINSASGDLTEALRDATDGHGLDFILDTTGLQQVIGGAFGALAVRGRLGLVGVSPAGTRIDLDPWAMLGGRVVEGNMEGDVVPDIFIPFLIDLHQQGRFPYERIVTQCGDLAAINEAVAAGHTGDVVKAVLTVN